MDDSKILELPFIEQIMEVAGKGEAKAIAILERIAGIQKERIKEKEKNKFCYVKFSPWYDTPSNYQTDPLKNGYMLLAMSYWKKGEIKLAKEAIQQAFVDTKLESTAVWKEKFDSDFYLFLQKASLDIGGKLCKKSIDQRIRYHLYATAKDWILENHPSGAAFIANCLKECRRYEEALECYKIALDNCEEEGKIGNLLAILSLCQEKNDPEAVITFTEKYYPEHRQKLEKEMSQDEGMILRYLNVAKVCKENGKNFNTMALFGPITVR